jgi:MFS family permease
MDSSPSVSALPTRSRFARVWSAIAAGGAALRHRNFRLFFWGQLISLVGTWMQSLAQSWLVFTLTHSAFQLGVVATFQFLPVFLLSLFAGVAVDRLPKRSLLVATQVSFMILAAVLGVLTVAHIVQVWQVYVIAALFGVVNAFDVPGRQAFMVEMAGKKDLLNAIALNSSIFNASRIFGPAIATLLIAQVGTGPCFILNAVSFIAVIVGLLLMHIERIPRIAAKTRPFTQIAEGLGYIASNERIWLVFFMVGVISIFGIPIYTTLAPIIATNVLHAGVNGFGILSTTLGAGALVGALLLAYVPPGPGRGRLHLIAALCYGIAVIAFGFMTSLLPAAILIAVVGFCVVSVNSAGLALIQEVTPNALRGRVMSVWGFTLIGLGPFGSFFAGSLAEVIGPQATIVISAAVCLAAAIYVNIRARRHHSFAAIPITPPTIETVQETLADELPLESVMAD